MNITLCGSIAFYDQMLEVQRTLETAGHMVKLPPPTEPDDQGNAMSVHDYYRLRRTTTDPNSWVWDRKADAMHEHFDKIVWADAILVLNYPKRDVPNYIGGNTLMEMGLAFHLKKKIYLLNPVPEQPYTEEILGCKPIVLDGELSKL